VQIEPARRAAGGRPPFTNVWKMPTRVAGRAAPCRAWRPTPCHPLDYWRSGPWAINRADGVMPFEGDERHPDGQRGRASMASIGALDRQRYVRPGVTIRAGLDGQASARRRTQLAADRSVRSPTASS